MSDDYMGDTTSFGPVLVDGSGVTGDLEVAGDADWFAILLVAGDTCQFAFDGLATHAGTLSDPCVYIRNSDGNLLARDDDSGAGLNSLLSFTVSRPGTCWLEARSHADRSAGTYTIAATRTGSIFDPVILIGASAADCLLGGAGNDSLDGGGGGDTLTGGTGVDAVLELGEVDFTLSDNGLTGLGTDVLRASKAPRCMAVTATTGSMRLPSPATSRHSSAAGPTTPTWVAGKSTGSRPPPAARSDSRLTTRN